MTFKRLLEDIAYLYLKQGILEMANMQTKDTGLSSIIHVMAKGGAKHGPRVKVSNIAGRFAHDDNFSITVENEPRIIGKSKLKKDHEDSIMDWVKLNYEHIHKVWHHGDIFS